MVPIAVQLFWVVAVSLFAFSTSHVRTEAVWYASPTYVFYCTSPEVLQHVADKANESNPYKAIAIEIAYLRQLPDETGSPSCDFLKNEYFVYAPFAGLVTERMVNHWSYVADDGVMYDVQMHEVITLDNSPIYILVTFPVYDGVVQPGYDPFLDMIGEPILKP